MRSGVTKFALTAAVLLLAGSGWAQTAATVEPATEVSLETCVNLVQETMGGETTHLEFESRDGVPTYEFIVESESGPTYYVGCDATSGLIAGVDVIVNADDERFVAVAQIAAEQAADTATQRYPGEVEEVKSLLLSTGQAVYEVDVEFEPEGEFNVYVDAASGEIFAVNIEYYEIGQSATAADQLDGSGAGSDASGGAGGNN